MRSMKFFFATTLVAAAAIYATSASADYATVIGNLSQFDNETVTVSGVVTRKDGNQDFILADNTGNIEVNLIAPFPNIAEGDYVTVQGVMDTSLGDELDTATITVGSHDYDTWYKTYYDTYGEYYDLAGVGSRFHEGMNWNSPIYGGYR